MNIEKLKKLLRAQSSNKYSIAKMFKEDENEDCYNTIMGEMIALDNVVRMLENDEYFTKVCAIYDIKDEDDRI